MSAENPPRSKQKTPEAFASNSEAYKYFKEAARGASGIFAELEESLKTTRTVIAAERRKKKFKSQPLIDALVEEQTRLKTVKKELEKKIGWILSATVPGTSLGAPSFRKKREVPTEKGGFVEQASRIPERTGRLVLGERPVNIHGEKIGESPDTTRLMTPEELNTYISSMREKVMFMDPIQKIGDAHEVPRDMIRVERPRGVWKPEPRVIDLDTPVLAGEADHISELPPEPTEPETEPEAIDVPRELEPSFEVVHEAPTVAANDKVPEKQEAARSLAESETELMNIVERYLLKGGTQDFASEAEASHALQEGFKTYLTILERENPARFYEIAEDVPGTIYGLGEQRVAAQMEHMGQKSLRRVIQQERSILTTGTAQERAFNLMLQTEAKETARKRKRFWRNALVALGALFATGTAYVATNPKPVFDSVATAVRNIDEMRVRMQHPQPLQPTELDTLTMGVAAAARAADAETPHAPIITVDDLKPQTARAVFTPEELAARNAAYARQGLEPATATSEATERAEDRPIS